MKVWSVHAGARSCSLSLLDDLARTTDETGSSGGDETDLLTSRLVSADSRGVTDMLMVTTTVRMLDGVHGNTSNSGPVVALSLVLVPGGVGTEQRLVGSLTASGDTNHGSAVAHDGLASAGGELDTGLAALISVADDNAGGAGSSGEGAAVTDLALAVGDDGTLGHSVHGKNVSHGKRGYLIIKN